MRNFKTKSGKGGEQFSVERFCVSAVWICFDINNIDSFFSLLSLALFISDLINEEPVGSCVKAGVPCPSPWQAVPVLSSRHDGSLLANIRWR